MAMPKFITKFFASNETETEKRERRSGPRKWIVTRRTAIEATHTPVGVLEDPDEVIRLAGLQTRTAFDEIQTDDHLTTVMGSRLAAVNSLEWDIVRDKASARVHKAVLRQFEQKAGNRMIDMQNTFREIMNKNAWGYAPLKLDWKLKENMWWIENIIGLPSWWFKFNDDNKPVFMSMGSPLEGEEAPKYRLIMARNNPTYENPYGEKLLSKSYWPITWKRNIIKWWNIFVEKFSIPGLVATLPTNADDDDIDKMLDMLNNMVQDSVMVKREGDVIDILEPSGKRASSDIFLAAIKYFDAALSKIWLGQPETTEMGSVGSYAALKTKQGVKDERRDTDVHEIEFVINTAIRWFVDINFGNVPAPEFIMSEPFEYDKTKAEIDGILCDKMGFRPNKKYIAAEYGKDEDHFEIVEPRQNTPPENGPPENKEKEFQFSSRDEKALEVAFQNLDDKELQAQAVKILQPIIELINKSEDYSEALDNLLRAAPKMDLTTAQKTIERAIFAGEVWGRINAK